MLMCIFQKILSILCDKSDHMVILFSFSVNIDGKIWLICCKIHSFSILIISFLFKLSCLLHIEHRIFTFRKISRNYLVGLIPFIGSDIHFKGLYEFTCFDIILLCKIKLSYFSIVLCDFFVVRTRDFWRLVCN